jgi:glycosyltransferase involved in cell wall biosynthesis
VEDDILRIGIITKGIATTGASTVGGGDVLNVYLLRALKELEHQVVLSTNSPTHWDTIERDLGWVCKPDIELKRSQHRILDKAKSFTQLITPSQIQMMKRTCDVTFNTYGDNLFWNTDLSYMLTPYTKEQLSAKYASTASKFYYKMYLTMLRKLKHSLRTLILTDSNYSKKIIEETMGLRSRVLYPPVDYALYRQALRKQHRLDHIVTVGRLTWEKNFRIIPEIACRVKNAVFDISGSIVSPESIEVLKFIKRRSSELNVSNRVRVHLNPSTAERLNILEKCKVYINCWKGEYFGIAVAEALSAGLATIVPDGGGQLEIAPSSEYVYHDLDEAAVLIKKWLQRWNPAQALRLSRAAERFGLENFKTELKKILTHLTRVRAS